MLGKNFPSTDFIHSSNTFIIGTIVFLSEKKCNDKNNTAVNVEKILRYSLEYTMYVKISDAVETRYILSRLVEMRCMSSR